MLGRAESDRQLNFVWNQWDPYCLEPTPPGPFLGLRFCPSGGAILCLPQATDFSGLLLTKMTEMEDKQTSHCALHEAVPGQNPTLVVSEFEAHANRVLETSHFASYPTRQRLRERQSNFIGIKTRQPQAIYFPLRLCEKPRTRDLWECAETGEF